MSYLDAEREARRLGLNVKAEYVVSSLPLGEVLQQSPEAGSKMRNSTTVLLKVSRGGIRREIPDVRKFSASQAQNVLQEHGFDIGDVVYIKDDSRPGGTVIAQSPSGPAIVPSDKKVDLLVSQGGAATDGRVVVPDVAGMVERQARELLTASGFKIAVVDSVYSPNDTDGHVIGTRPAGGTTARAGDGIRLRIATSKRPDGVPERPVQAQTNATTVTSSPQIVVTVPGQGNVLIGDEPPNPLSPSQVQSVNTEISVFDQQRQPATSQTSAQSSQQTAQTQQPAGNQQANLEPVGGKIAKIRYQVPPLARPLQLKIELMDPSGTKVLLDRDARSGEYVSLDAPYSKECVVMIYLGNQFVWQDRYM